MSIVTYNLPILHRHHPLLQRVDDPLVVRRQNDRCSHVIDLLQYLNDVVGIHRVEISRRLVGDQYIGLLNDSTRDGDTLLLPSGELVRKMQRF